MDEVHVVQLCRAQSRVGGVRLENNTQGQHRDQQWIQALPIPMLGGKVHSPLYAGEILLG